MKYVLSFCPEWPNCQKVPRMDILDNNTEIIVRCPCGYDQVLPLEEYLKKLEYEDCIGLLLSPPEIEKGRAVLKEAEEHVKTYLDELKSEALKSNEKVEEINKAYDACKKRCEKVLYLVKQFTINYYRKNEQMLKNIVHNTTFSLKKCESKEISKIIEFFNTYCVLVPLDTTDYNFIDSKAPLPKFNDKINGIFKLKDGRIAIYSFEKTIDIIDIANNYHVDMVIKGHPGGVLAMDQFENGNIVSLSNTTIKLWSITKDSYKCLHTIQYPKFHTVDTLVCLNNNFIAVSAEHSIQIYDLNEGKYSDKPVKELKEHKSQVQKFLFVPSKHIFISLNKENNDFICIWNSDTFELIKKGDSITFDYDFTRADKMLTCDRLTWLHKERHLRQFDINLQESELSGHYKRGNMIKTRHPGVYLLTFRRGELITYNYETGEDQVFKFKYDSEFLDMIPIDQHHIMTLPEDGSEVKVWRY